MGINDTPVMILAYENSDDRWRYDSGQVAE